jgi:hypothetical protein
MFRPLHLPRQDGFGTMVARWGMALVETLVRSRFSSPGPN